MADVKTIIADEKTPDGKWLASRTTEAGRVFTRAWVYFNNMRNRCNPAGAQQRIRENYQGCINAFGTFQSFADWALQQPGYGIDGWCLDKDLLVKGNKTYSALTCVFVPTAINNALTNRRLHRGPLPIGVAIDSRTGKTFRAYIASNGKDIRIGAFPTIEEAFTAYKERKEESLRALAEKFKEQIDPRAYHALMHYQIEITD